MRPAKGKSLDTDHQLQIARSLNHQIQIAKSPDREITQLRLL
jgi:hypothetical protein